MISKRAVRFGLAILSWVGLQGTLDADTLSILYHERLRDLGVRQAIGAVELTFVAFGRQFAVELAPNDALASALPQAQRASIGDLSLYRGQLAGVPSSWVRLSRSESTWTGVVWDGTELYFIDEYSRVASQLVSPDSLGDGSPVIYRWSETVGLLVDTVVRREPSTREKGETTPFPSLKSLAGIWPGKQLDVALIADVEYTAREGAQTESTLLSTLNIVDGIYISQVGIKLNAAHIETFSNETDPFTATEGSLLLDELANHKEAVPALRAQGLAHLFTGRDLTRSGGAQAVGIATLATLCDPRFSVGITQATFGTSMNALIVAHEVGHNFGAPHDNEPGTACANAGSNYIMAPTLNGSAEFSACSVEQMLPEISAASCLRDLPPANITLQLLQPPPGVVGEAQGFGLRIAIENTRTTDAIGAEFFVTNRLLSGPSPTIFGAPTGSRCFTSGGYRCVWPSFPAGTRMEVILSFAAASPGTGSIDISVSSLSESDLSSDTLHFDLEIVPRVDLGVSLSPTAVQLHPGESATMRAAVRNNGAFAATQVSAFLQVNYLVELVDSGLGQCTWNGDTYLYGYNCIIGTLPAGASREFDVRVRSRTGFSDAELAAGTWLDLYASATQGDPFTANNRTSSRITLGSSIADVALTLSGPAALVVNEPFIYELRVANNGPDTANDVEIRHHELGVPLPRSFSSVSSTSAACTMQPPANDFVCLLAALPRNQSFTVTFVGTVQTAGEFGFGVFGRSNSPDWDSTNNLASLFPRATAAAPAPSPAPSPAPAPAPAPTPSAPPSLPAQASGGSGGGATEIMFVGLLLLGLLARGPHEYRRAPNPPSRG
jgi:hypothetical protein